MNKVEQMPTIEDGSYIADGVIYPPAQQMVDGLRASIANREFGGRAFRWGIRGGAVLVGVSVLFTGGVTLDHFTHDSGFDLGGILPQIGPDVSFAQGLTPTPLADCLIRLTLISRFKQPDGTILGTAPGIPYDLAAGKAGAGRETIRVVTDGQGVGFTEKDNKAIIEFRGSSDSKADDGRRAMMYTVRNLNNNESASKPAACKGPNDAPTEVQDTINIGKTQPTIGKGTAFTEKGPTLVVTPAPTKITGAKGPEGTPGPTQGVTVNPTQVPEGTPAVEPTPNPTPTVAGSNAGGSGIGLNIGFEGVTDRIGGAANTARENPVPVIGGIAALLLVINRPFAPRTRLWNTAAWPVRFARYRRALAAHTAAAAAGGAPAGAAPTAPIGAFSA